MITEVRPRKSIEKELFVRVRAGQCIHHADDEHGNRTWCDRDAATLGLCTKHYQACRRAMCNLPLDQEAQAKTDLIREGQLLSPQMMREIKGLTVYRKAAQKVAG